MQCRPCRVCMHFTCSMRPHSTIRATMIQPKVVHLPVTFMPSTAYLITLM